MPKKTGGFERRPRHGRDTDQRPGRSAPTSSSIARTRARCSASFQRSSTPKSWGCRSTSWSCQAHEGSCWSPGRPVPANDHAVRDDRLHQQNPHRPHHHDRRPIEFVHDDEVPINQREGSNHTRSSRTRCARRCAKIPTSSWWADCATWKRSLRGDGRNRPPRVRHAAHDHRGVDRRSVIDQVPDRTRRRSASCCRSRSRA